MIYIVSTLYATHWQQVLRTSDLQAALDFCKAEQKAGFFSNIETSNGNHIFGDKYGSIIVNDFNQFKINL